MKIGFIGLGIMGKPMAANLLNAGHGLMVYDLMLANVDAIVCLGAMGAASIADLAKECSVIITMLPNSPHVEQVVCGEGGILSAAKQGTIIIDMSSIAPEASQHISEECRKKGIQMLDAPVSGGEPKAIDGTLSIMVGGSQTLFDQVKEEILLKMGSAAVYCGPIGAGNTTKLVNQIIVACNIAACAEAFTLARKAGVDPELVYQAIRGGLAGSTVMDAKVPMMIQRNRRPGFKVDLHVKDLNNALETAHSVGAPLPLSAMVMEMLQTLHADGLGDSDHSCLAEYYAKVSGSSIGG